MDVPHFIYPFVSWWTSGLFPLFGYYGQYYCEHLCTDLCLNMCFHFFWIYTRSGIPGSNGNFVFNLLRSWQTVFQSDCPILLSYQQWLGILNFPHPWQYFFLITAILVGVKCLIIQILIYLSLMAVVLEKTLESSLDCKEIQPVHSKGDQSWDFFGRNDAEAETPVLWPPHVKSWRIGKDSDAGRDWGQEEKVTTEDEMAGWHHWLDGRESEWTPGVGDGQGGLAYCDSWGRKELDTTERLNWLNGCWYWAFFCM